MLDKLNDFIEKINYSIHSVNVQRNLYQNGDGYPKLPLLKKSPPFDEIPAFSHLLNETSSICRAYEQELWKDRPDYRFAADMANDIIDKTRFIGSLIEGFNF